MTRRPVSPFTLTLRLLTIAGVALLTLPTAALLWRALGGISALSDDATQATLRDALRLSFTTSTLSLALIVIVGTPIAYTLARSNSTAARIVDALVDLPIILPPAVAGIALLTAFGRNGILGGWLNEFGIRIGFTTTAVILAQIFVAAPFYIRAARAGFLRMDAQLEEVAADLGSPPARVFFKVTLPIARSSLIAGAVLAWARAIGEFGATIMFAGNRQGVTQTMPLAIYERFGAGDLRAAIALSAILLIVSVTFLVVIRTVGERES